jgi:hypothetical protein
MEWFSRKNIDSGHSNSQLGTSLGVIIVIWLIYEYIS